MKQLARQYCYWTGIDKEIECLAKACKECMQIKKEPVKEMLHQWEEPIENFQRIHMDYAGLFQGHHFFIVIDAKSKWPEVFSQKGTPTSSSTIKILRNIFSRHGFPEVLVSDNAAIFKSEEFSRFCNQCSITQKFIAPGHPATNGLAERHVQTFKNKLKTMETDPKPLEEKLQEILMRFRATPLKCGKSPAELYLNRKMRIELDFLRPLYIEGNNVTQPPVHQLSVGDRVLARVYASKVQWKPGVVRKVLGRLHYMVELDEGYTFKRHKDQLQRTEIERVECSIPLKKDRCAGIENYYLLRHPRSGLQQQLPSHQSSLPLQPPLAHSSLLQQPPLAQAANTTTSLRTSARERRRPKHLDQYSS
jgi:transposase InsO family protein